MLNTNRGKRGPLYLDDCPEMCFSWFKNKRGLSVCKKQNTEILNCICRLQLSEVLEVTLLIFSSNHIKMASLTLEINLLCYANLLKFYCAINLSHFQLEALAGRVPTSHCFSKTFICKESCDGEHGLQYLIQVLQKH